ncbi:MAG: c-type cytochrome [Planctomycetaceae bacterium]|nr:c-type cytochrome [Planctomycetaceae bacterium]
MKAGALKSIVLIGSLCQIVPAFAQLSDPEPDQTAAAPARLAPLPAAPEVDVRQAELGRRLFFDARLSGDATISCATCHDPDSGWADGLPMSDGYPGSRYFRNTPTVVNASLGKLVYWDGRLPAADLPTVVRDHISEAHFFQADGRLVIERLRQVPAYEREFREAFGGEPTYGRILNAVSAFLKTLRSRDVPFDRFLNGQTDAISEPAQRGLKLFRGKAACITCHHGPMLSDGDFHSLGLAANPDLFADPLRHITFRRFFRTLGVPGYERLRRDPGLLCVSKDRADMGKMRTPTLRELVSTAPYMHDGRLKTLADVVAFYNAGGGPDGTKDARLQPLQLTDQEQADLVAFLESLSGPPLTIKRPEIPDYELRPLGENK